MTHRVCTPQTLVLLPVAGTEGCMPAQAWISPGCPCVSIIRALFPAPALGRLVLEPPLPPAPPLTASWLQDCICTRIAHLTLQTQHKARLTCSFFLPSPLLLSSSLRPSAHLGGKSGLPPLNGAHPSSQLQPTAQQVPCGARREGDSVRGARPGDTPFCVFLRLLFLMRPPWTQFPCLFCPALSPTLKERLSAFLHISYSS